MKILLIGSRGFTGQHLLAALAETPAYQLVEASTLGLDLTQPASINAALAACRPDAVVNLGAISHVGGDLRRTYEVNAFGQLNLLDALKASGFTGRLIFASTANVYGDRTPEPIVEGRCPDPVNHYACSKLLAENFCRMAQASFEIVITRPFSCIGRGQASHFLVPKIVDHFRRRAPVLEMGNVDVERDFIDIRDAVAVYRLLLEAPRPPGLVHICTGRTRSIRQLVQACADLSGHVAEIRVNQAFVRPNDLLYQCGSPALLAQLGFRPRFSPEDTLEWMLRS